MAHRSPPFLDASLRNPEFPCVRPCVPETRGGAAGPEAVLAPAPGTPRRAPRRSIHRRSMFSTFRLLLASLLFASLPNAAHVPHKINPWTRPGGKPAVARRYRAADLP